MLRRLACLGVLAVLAIGTGGTAASARPGDPVPKPITHPGGLAPDAAQPRTGDCELSMVTCKPQQQSGSCTGYTSQTTTPSTIKVLVRTSSTKVTITTVPFEQYVENVLPNEWVPSWDGDALKAGAVAVKSYAWYWITHFGGYLNNDPTQCFDVTDDPDFQVYKADTAQARTTSAVEATWPYAAREDGQVIQASYRAYLSSTSEPCGTDADGTTLSQWGSQNCVEANTGNKWNVILDTYYGPDLQLATTRQLRTQHDFQYLQRSTRATFAAGRWAIDDGYPTDFSFGTTGDLPTVTTDGDGFARIGVFRPSTGAWYIGSPTGTVASKTIFGTNGDVPVQAQYAGVHSPTVLAVFRPSNGAWYSATPTAQVPARTLWGTRGDIPVPGHYAGVASTDSAAGIAVFRPSTGKWYIRGGPTVHWGQQGDIPVPADYNGDGTTDIAVYRPSNHRFYIRGQASVLWGTTGDIPVTGDYTGDGRADLVVYRPSNHTWYVRGGTYVSFGAAGVSPVGAAPYSD